MLVRTVLGLVIVLGLRPPAAAETPTPRVDPRFEMISLVFRLAKAHE